MVKKLSQKYSLVKDDRIDVNYSDVTFNSRSAFQTSIRQTLELLR